MTEPLEGLRVIDLTRYIPGPYCAMLLGDLGADVVKVEEPPLGDPTRALPPADGENSAAHAALKSLTNQDFGPAKDASAKDRAQAMDSWKRWWAKQERK